MRRLRNNHLYAKVEKCEFDVDKTNFLGFIISPDGLQMDDSKVQTIRDWQEIRLVDVEFALLDFRVQVVIAEATHDFLHMLEVFVRSVGIDQYVVLQSPRS